MTKCKYFHSRKYDVNQNLNECDHVEAKLVEIKNDNLVDVDYLLFLTWCYAKATKLGHHLFQ